MRTTNASHKSPGLNPSLASTSSPVVSTVATQVPLTRFRHVCQPVRPAKSLIVRP